MGYWGALRTGTRLAAARFYHFSRSRVENHQLAVGQAEGAQEK